MRAFSWAILRLIVSDWTKAATALEKAGYVVNVTEVVAIEVADSPGGLTEVMEALDKINMLAGVDVYNRVS